MHADTQLRTELRFLLFTRACTPMGNALSKSVTAASIIVLSTHLPQLLRRSPSHLRRTFGLWCAAVLLCSRLSAARRDSLEDLSVKVVPIGATAILLCSAFGLNRTALPALSSQSRVALFVLFSSVPTFAAALDHYKNKLFRAWALFIPGTSQSDEGDKSNDGEEPDLPALLSVVLGLLRGHDIASLVILLMLTGGEALEQLAVSRAQRGLRQLEALRPKRACRICRSLPEGARHSGNEREEVAVDALAVGDLVMVRPGERVPVDGTVLEGSADVDSSALTGECIPQRRRVGAQVLAGEVLLLTDRHGRPTQSDVAGTVDECSTMIIRVQHAANDSAFARIQQQLQLGAGQRCKSASERLAEEHANVFIPASLALAAAALLAHGRRSRTCGRATSASVARMNRAWDACLAVLMAATPCPLSIGVPTGFMAAVSVAARSGITIKHRDALQFAGAATCAVWDKTGTLTLAQPVVSRVSICSNHCDEWDELSLLQLAASVETHSTHPLAHAIVQSFAQRYREKRSAVQSTRNAPKEPKGEGETQEGSGMLRVDEVAEMSAGGMKARIWRRTMRAQGRQGAKGGGVRVLQPHGVLIGQGQFLRDCGIELCDMGSAEVTNRGGSMLAHVAVDGIHVGTICFQDQLRPDAREVVTILRHLGVRRHIVLSGDASGRAATVAKAIGADEVHVCLPHEKVEHVQRLRHHEGETVIFVGDGINDAPALFAAHVGVSLGVNELACEAANVVLLREDVASDKPSTIAPSTQQRGALMQIVTLVALGRHVVRVVSDGVRGGMGVACIQMLFAATGAVNPVTNAVLQECVDLGTIMNALRVINLDPNKLCLGLLPSI